MCTDKVISYVAVKFVKNRNWTREDLLDWTTGTESNLFMEGCCINDCLISLNQKYKTIRNETETVSVSDFLETEIKDKVSDSSVEEEKKKYSKHYRFFVTTRCL